MPNILLVAATPFEIAAVSEHFKIKVNGDGLFQGNNHVSVLITGVGMVNTAYWMGRISSHNYDHVINVGICGSYQSSLKIGEIVQVTSDILAELGAEDGDQFIPFAELKLGGTAFYQSKCDLKSTFLDTIKKVKGVTVNKVHGNDKSINTTMRLYNPDIESMEGAAFFRGCGHLKCCCIQIRAISNRVEKRDTSKWNMPLAINNLNDFTLQYIHTLNT